MDAENIIAQTSLSFTELDYLCEILERNFKNKDNMSNIDIVHILHIAAKEQGHDIVL